MDWIGLMISYTSLNLSSVLSVSIDPSITSVNWISRRTTRSLAVANRSRVNSAHEVTTVQFREGAVHGKETWDTDGDAAAATSIKFTSTKHL